MASKKFKDVILDLDGDVTGTAFILSFDLLG